uniref:P68 family surface lipoprotein n=1 Tax=Mycoplasmoides pneumoniae TaxID=2104 RepID=UPI00133052D9
IYGIPVSLSTEVLSINGPVLHYILKSAKGDSDNVKVSQRTGETTQKSKVTNPLKINTQNDPATKDLWEKIEASAKANGKSNKDGQTKGKKKVEKSSSSSLVNLKQSTDQTTTDDGSQKSDNKIKESWGEYQEVDGGLKNFEFKASIFENWHDLLDFSTRVAKSFTNVKGKDIKKGTDIQGVLGVDSTPNSLFTSVFAAGGGDYNNFFYKIENGRADFSNFKNKGTSYQNLQKVFGDFKGLIDKNGIFVNKGGSYSSNFQKFHQLAYSISSTSGFFYSFAGKSAKRLNFGDSFIEYPRFTQEIKAPSKNGENGQTNEGNSTNGEQNLLGTFEVKDDSKPKEEVKSNKNSGKESSQNQGKKSNNNKTIYLYETKIPDGKTAGDNAILIKDKNVIEKLKSAAKEENKEQTAEATKAAITSNKAKSTKKESSKVIGYTTTDSVREDGKNIFAIDRVNGENYDRKIIVGAKAETLNQSSTLQSEEAIVLPAPGKYLNGDPKKVTITQGPNIIGIHANEKENAETQKFVDWFLNSPQTWEKQSRDKKGSSEKQTAAEFFAESASYILPLKEIFDKNDTKTEKGKNSKTQQRTNTYAEKALELFKQISQNQIVSYSDPSDFRSGKFRDAIGATFNAAVSSKADFNKFVQNFTATLGSDI